jgi:hypothetical protein
MHRLIIFLLFEFLHYSGISQHMGHLLNFPHNDSPRVRPNANYPGYYEVASKFSQLLIDPSDTIDLQVYFTGYGMIENSKLMVFTSGNIFDAEHSYMASSIKVDSIRLLNGADSFHIAWGNTTGPIFDEPTSVYYLGGVKFNEWTQETIFFDAHPSQAKDLGIISEQYLDGPPVLLHLKTQKDISGGEYEINLYFTYFNGQEWKGSKQIVRFKVRSWIEQHETFGWFLAAAAALFTIILPIFERLWALLVRHKELKAKARELKKSKPQKT